MKLIKIPTISTSSKTMFFAILFDILLVSKGMDGDAYGTRSDMVETFLSSCNHDRLGWGK
jgi:hypothetical protein